MPPGRPGYGLATPINRALTALLNAIRQHISSEDVEHCMTLASIVRLDNGACVVHSASTQRLTCAEVAAAAQARQRPLRAQKLYRVSQSPHLTSCTAHIVEVEVDPDTGQVTLLDVVTAHDVGIWLHDLPITAEKIYQGLQSRDGRTT